MIISGRRINDKMGFYVVEQVTKLMTKKRINFVDANVLIMGLTFKENCSDIRNTRVVDLVEGFKAFNLNVDVYDPWANKEEAINEYDIKLTDQPVKGKYDAIILAVAHNEFKKLSSEQIRNFGKENNVIYDIKYLLNHEDVDGRL
jgi:UDP-N-acetyl-D-galactosamine dehydrogenase